MLQMVSDGDDCLVRLGCACGDPSLALYHSEDDQIIFCTRCGEITTRQRLINESAMPLTPARNLIWINVANRAECPLVNVSIPVQVFFDASSAPSAELAMPGVVTKISTDKCFFRLEEGAGPTQISLQSEVRLRAEECPLEGETWGWLEEVLHPHGPHGPAYYKVRLALTSLQRKNELESFFQSTCGLKFDWRVLLYADLESANHLRRLLRDCLPMARFDIANNATDFIRLFREHGPDLCILPPVSELMRVVREARGAVRPTQGMIAVTRQRTSLVISQAIQGGADDILLEDCTLEDMRRAIQRCQRKEVAPVRPEDDDSLTKSHEPVPSEPSATVAVTEDDTVRMLCMASETHDPNSSSHLKRIAAYTGAIARIMGWPSWRVARLATASKLHDVGKMGVPDEILRKPGALTEDEREIMKQHSRFGYHILHTSSSELMRMGATIALQHHERYDGRGYPDGLVGDATPIEAQIVTAADVFDALTTARPYKPAWSNEQAIEHLREQAGKLFAPAVIEAFLKVRPEIERNQLHFLDDFRDIWTERRQYPRLPIAPVPVSLEIAMPEQTFRPYRLEGHLSNLSLGGLKVMLNNVSNDLFTVLIGSRRYVKLSCTDPVWQALHQAFCSVVWIDYYAVPDPSGCLMGLAFQRIPDLDEALRELGQNRN